MANLEKIVEDLSALTVLEAAELSKMLEEKWGVSAAAAVSVAGPAAGALVLKREDIESWTCTARRDWDDHTWSILQEVVHNPADPEYANRKPSRRQRTYHVHGSPYPPAPGRIAFMSMSFAPLATTACA